ncbi:hypothetical protein [Agrobacterium sp. 22117]|uniref:hypothetical protein n=1 Tax=Agrobacterium sp. 22117 TaxID=3453880 RepID=UPI003F841F05
MTSFNTAPIRKAVLESEQPIVAAAVVIGAMIDLLATHYGIEVASNVAHSLASAVDEEATPPEAAPDHQQT